MAISRASAGLIVTLAVLAAGTAAIGQDRPESILPPGFGDQPAPAPTATRAPPSANPAAPVAPVVTPPPGAPLALGPNGQPLPTPTPSATPTVDAATLARYEMPAYARRSIDLVGPAGPAQGALGQNAFGKADGRYLETLMRRLDAPIASRWASIALRRALVSQVDTPSHVNGADFAAERAWLLLRMGESVAARDLVQSVDADNFTPKLYQIGMQAWLATGDPAGLCALADTGFARTAERGWLLAQAMCAGLAGYPAKVAPMLKAAQRQTGAGGVDFLLAQKVAGSGAGGRQAVTIEWDDVDRLTIWRYGLALATGTAVPDNLIAAASPAVVSWQALAPGITAAARAKFADVAAARGVLSSAALVDLYGSIDQDDDEAAGEASIARTARDAFAAPDLAGRLAAMKQLWDEPQGSELRFARLILTARAAARIPAGADGADADRLIASILTAGLDRPALAWRNRVARGSDAWAMLLLADPMHARYAYNDLAAYGGNGTDAEHKRRMFFAGMAGLARMPAPEIEKGAQALDVRIGATNAWVRAIDRAASQRQPGTAVLLAAVGMQTRSWRGISPEALYHIVAALRETGREGEARMIAAEAIARL